MNTPNRGLAFIAYLLSIVGWLIVLVVGRRDRFAAFHARQSLALLLFLVLVTAGWYVIFWLTSFVPYLAIIGLSLFSLVIAAFVFALYAWIRGMSNALNARMTALPIVGKLAQRLPPA